MLKGWLHFIFRSTQAGSIAVSEAIRLYLWERSGWGPGDKANLTASVFLSCCSSWGSEPGSLQLEAWWCAGRERMQNKQKSIWFLILFTLLSLCCFPVAAGSFHLLGLPENDRASSFVWTRQGCCQFPQTSNFPAYHLYKDCTVWKERSLLIALNFVSLKQTSWHKGNVQPVAAHSESSLSGAVLWVSGDYGVGFVYG